MAGKFTFFGLDGKASRMRTVFSWLPIFAQCCYSRLQTLSITASEVCFRHWHRIHDLETVWAAPMYSRTSQTFSAQLLSFHSLCFTVKGLGMRKPSSWSYIMTILCPLEGRRVLDLRWGCSKPTSSSTSERWELTDTTLNAYVVITLDWVKVAKVTGV